MESNEPCLQRTYDLTNDMRTTGHRGDQYSSEIQTERLRASPLLPLEGTLIYPSIIPPVSCGYRYSPGAAVVAGGEGVCVYT